MTANNTEIQRQVTVKIAETLEDKNLNLAEKLGILEILKSSYIAAALSNDR